MAIIVQLRPEIASELRSSASGRQSITDVEEVLRELGVDLRPLHPSVTDEVLSTYFVASVSGRAESAHVVQRLRACEGVEAAYVKGATEDPS